MKGTCQNCCHFDGSKHQKDPRTQHAGICSKWTEIVFQSETCKQYFSNENKSEKEIFPLIDTTQLPPINQLSFFN